MNKRLFYSGFIIVLLISICLYLYFYSVSKEKEKEVLTENMVWVVEKASDLKLEDIDRNKTINFIQNSLPKKIDVKNIGEMFHDAITSEKMSDKELQESILAELYYSIKDKDAGILVSLFDINSYMVFANLYQSHAELVAAQNQLLNSIDKSGSFESISFIRRDERVFTVVFNYKSSEPIKIDLKIKRYVEDGTKNHYYYSIDSSFMEFYEAFNKPSN